MSTFAISFDLKYDDTYSDRYDSLMKVIRRQKKVWTETTSFALVESSSSLASLEQDLYLSSFSASKDKLLVVDVSYDKAIARGHIGNKNAGGAPAWYSNKLSRRTPVILAFVARRCKLRPASSLD